MKNKTGCAKPERRQAEARSSTANSCPASKRSAVVPRKPLPPAERVLRKSALSPARQRLVEIMQELGYGRIRRLIVSGGEPIMDPPPRVLRHKRLAGAKKAKPDTRRGDFILKSQLVELFDEFDRLGNGIVDTIKVQDGLPCGFDVEEPGLK